MTKIEKKILLKDLCARLPYKPQVICNGKIEKLTTLHIFDMMHLKDEYVNIKPYLRPMSDMTEKEINEYRSLSDEIIGYYGPLDRECITHCVRLGIKPGNPHECIDDYLNMEAIDYLNAHHLDYRGLIPEGLALPALEGIYKFN